MTDDAATPAPSAPPADPDALASALLAIWDDPRRGDRMGHDGRRAVEDRFDIRRMAADYKDICREGTTRRARTGDRSAAPEPAVESSPAME